MPGWVIEKRAWVPSINKTILRVLRNVPSLVFVSIEKVDHHCDRTTNGRVVSGAACTFVRSFERDHAIVIQI